jgi:hypothetical protein
MSSHSSGVSIKSRTSERRTTVEHFVSIVFFPFSHSLCLFQLVIKNTNNSQNIEILWKIIFILD